MKPVRRAFVIGGSHTDFLGRGHPRFVHPSHGQNPTLEDHLRNAVRSVLEETNVPAAAVDRIVVSNFLGECFARQGHLSSLLIGAHPDLAGKPSFRVEAACASGGVALWTAVEAIAAGADLVLVVGGEVENNVRARDGVEYMAYAGHMAKQRSLAFALFPYLFARRSQAYKQRHGLSDADVARVVLKSWTNASKNPLALKQNATITLDALLAASEHNREFLEDPALAPHMRTFECTDFTDGASALLLASEKGLVELDIDAASTIEIAGMGFSVQDLGEPADPTALHNVARAADRAYAASGLSPSEMEVAEVHDCFSITELQAVDALKISPPGRAAEWLAEGRTAIEGSIPVNTGGGLLGFGHPIGATGVKQIIELWRQIQGRCGAYQMPRRPRTGVAANLGGDDRTAVVTVVRVPA